MPQIIPNLWFDAQGLEAAKFCISVGQDRPGCAAGRR